VVKKKEKPVKIITLDTETYEGLIGKLKRIAIYDGNKVTYGYNFLDIEPVLLDYYNLGYDVHIYIHNIEFDARKIPEIFDESRIVWGKCFVINNKLATIKCKYYTFHDSFKILPMSLKQLSGTKGFDVEHGKLDLFEAIQTHYPNQYDIRNKVLTPVKINKKVLYDEYTGEPVMEHKILQRETLVNFLDKCPVDDDLFLEYLGYDVLSLYEILQKLMTVAYMEEKDFCKIISTASLSRYFFKNGYNGKQFMCGSQKAYDLLCSFVYNNYPELEEFLRDAYCGGRTEVFKPFLEGNGKHYDVNSLYPYEMKIKLFPIGRPDHTINSDKAEKIFKKWLTDHKGIGFLSCEIYIPKQHIPPLPAKMGKLVFPCGHIYGVWHFEELEYAINNCGCRIEEYREVIIYSRTEPIFKEFIECFEKIKIDSEQEGNYALRTLAKLVMNTGYGYTATIREKEKIMSIKNLPNHRQDVKYINNIDGYIVCNTKMTAEYIQVQVAASVTAYARLDLLRGLRNANEKGNVYYCDTDSIVTDISLDNSMVDKYQLGKFKLETEPKRGLFLKPKVYAEVFEETDKSSGVTTSYDTVKFKGVSKDTQEQLTYNDYEYLLTELKAQNKKSVTVEHDKIVQRSIMFMKKTNLDWGYYEQRDKVFNLDMSKDKRRTFYEQNKTEPLYFNTTKDFENFSFAIDEEVDFTQSEDCKNDEQRN
jgi:hypothetical protein